MIQLIQECVDPLNARYEKDKMAKLGLYIICLKLIFHIYPSYFLYLSIMNFSYSSIMIFSYSSIMIFFIFIHHDFFIFVMMFSYSCIMIFDICPSCSFFIFIPHDFTDNNIIITSNTGQQALHWFLKKLSRPGQLSKKHPQNGHQMESKPYKI